MTGGDLLVTPRPLLEEEWRPSVTSAPPFTESGARRHVPSALSLPVGTPRCAWATTPSRTRAKACKCLHIAIGRKVRWQEKGLWEK